MNAFGGGDLLGANPMQANAFGAQPMGGNMFGGGAPSFPSYTAYEDANMTIGFAFDKQSASQVTVTAHVKNKSSVTLNQIKLQVAAQKYMKMNIKAASGQSLAPGS